MTSKEALKTLNKYRNSHYNSVNEEERELANALNVILPEYVKLAERDTPMLPLVFKDSIDCPKCRSYVFPPHEFCENCGQILDWSVLNEN